MLRERFHDDIRLWPQDSEHCDMIVPGHSGRIRIRSNFAAFQRDAVEIPCAHWAPRDARWLPTPRLSLPAPGVTSLPARLITQDSFGRLLHYDVLGLTYWMLSRREEVGAQALDLHQRFPAESSHAWRHGYLERPIVDEWFEVLRRLIQAVWPSLPVRETRYTVSLSHDVDTPARYALMGLPRLARSMCADLMRRRDVKTLLQAPSIWARSAQRIDSRDPYNTFDWIMARSEAVGLRSAFYFICGQTDRRRDGSYTPEHPAIIDLMRRIHDRGHEIGLHPSYHCYRDPRALVREAERLRSICEQAGIATSSMGARMHYLRWATPTTLHGLEAAGLRYDTTLGYALQPGFRCGTCHEYTAFDPVENRPLQLRIRPLIVMESTVVRRAYPDGMAGAERHVEALMEACRRVNGRFTLLWHNTLLEHAQHRRLYERVLGHYLKGRK